MTETKKPRTRKPKAENAGGAAAQENPERVAVLRTHVGFPLIIRSNPSEDQVKGFVLEHNRRYHSGEPGGPSGQPAFLIQGAAFYPSEADIEDESKATPIEL